MFCVILFASANICYANGKFKISDIDSISRKDLSTGIKITDLGGNTFQLTFKMPRKKGIPHSSSFIVTDSLDKMHTSKISLANEVCNAYMRPGSEYNYPCYIRATLPKNKQDYNPIYRDFIATISIKKDSIQLEEIIKGKMPELAASLKASKANNNYDILQITNISSKKIVITKINSESHIDLQNISEINLQPDESYDIDLNLKDNITMVKTTYPTDAITITYEDVNYMELSSEVKLIINPINNNDERIGTNNEAASNPKFSSGNHKLEIIEQKLEILSESSEEYSLPIKDNTENNITIDIIELESECIHSEKNNTRIKLPSYDTAETKSQITRETNRSHWYNWNNYGWKTKTVLTSGTVLVTVVLGYELFSEKINPELFKAIYLVNNSLAKKIFRTALGKAGLQSFIANDKLTFIDPNGLYDETAPTIDDLNTLYEALKNII